MALQVLRTKQSMVATQIPSNTVQTSTQTTKPNEKQIMTDLNKKLAEPRVRKVDISYIVEHKPSTSVVRKWLIKNVDGINEDHKRLDL